MGEEQPGGLVIVRAPSTRPPSHPPPSRSETQPQQRPPPRSASVQPTQLHPHNANASKPPSKKFRAGSVDTATQQHRTAKGKEREPLPGSRTEPEMDEEVRQMQSETDNLRQKPRVANGAINPAFQFPLEPSTPEDNFRGRTILQPIPESETPQILKNKIMRGEAHPRRRSSLTRGKRASSSYENTGVISGCSCVHTVMWCPEIQCDLFVVFFSSF